MTATLPLPLNSIERRIWNMKDNNPNRHRHVGMKLNRNIYSPMGTLVIPASTILTQVEVDLLNELNIELGEGDVEESSIHRLVHSSLREIRDAFEHVRFSDLLPCDQAYANIVPIIAHMSRFTGMRSVFAYLERQDEYTYRHSIGVALMAGIIGQALGLSERDQHELTIAGLIHDVGKTMIPPEILHKPGRLTPEEFERVKYHTVHGYMIISNTAGISERQALVALQHHEREDGSGYPYGLKGDEIDFFSKVVAAADVFHAMISRRSYRDPIPFYQVFRELYGHSFGKLERSITRTFLKRMMDLTLGSRVLLSDGREGVIRMVKETAPVDPIVEVDGKCIDLSVESSIGLVRFL